MDKDKMVRIIEDILEIRVIRELITEIREELQNRRMYRREYLLKLDDIISNLSKMVPAQDRKGEGGAFGRDDKSYPEP